MPDSQHITTGGGRQPDMLWVLEALANRTHDAFLITKAEPVSAADGGPEIVYVNPAFTRMTGYEPDEIVGRTPRVLQDDDTDRAELDRLRHALNRWKPVRATLLNRAKDGSRFWVEFDIVPIPDEDGWYRYWASIQRDVTERVETHKRLQHQRKLNALGEMAGGMAHELNNALQPVVGLTGVLRSRLESDSPDLARQCGVLERHADYARKVVGDVLAFARDEEPAPDVLPVDAILADATAFVARVMPATIDLEAEGFPPDTSTVPNGTRVRVTRNGMIQVLQHLVQNAADAMGGRGTVTIALHANAPARADEAPARVHIAVSDHGAGMDAETAQRIFTPFFSTKPVGHGTGMGLAVVHGQVTGWGGALDVSSQPGAGTTMTISLPTTTDPPTRAGGDGATVNAAGTASAA